MLRGVDGVRVILAPELREYARQVRAQTAEIRALFGGHDEAALYWRPDPTQWSIAQHVSHLTLATRSWLSAIDAAVERTRARGFTGPGPYRHGGLGNLVVRMMEPPSRLRFRAGGELDPGEPGPAAAVLADFLGAQLELERSIVRANGVDLGRPRVRLPFVKGIRLTAGQTYRLILAHNRRHLWHIWRLERAPGFPGREREGGRVEEG